MNGRSRVMRTMVAHLSDADIDALADYLSQVNRAAGK